MTSPQTARETTTVDAIVPAIPAGPWAAYLMVFRSFLSLSSDAFCAGEMRRQELSGSVQCSGRFVKHRGKIGRAHV